MSDQKAALAIEYEVAKIGVTHSPVPDHTFVMGMIELAEFCELIDPAKANQYRNELDDKRSKRINDLKGVAA
ncbi:hypothetical protein [Pseudomonas moorei]|uniref:Uncharacterized protein n=1 Tax=Pseudomonas moorei TaxID=395599 RepID=A0A1H1FLW6_9PSED|nr:hypothetical protein [Pseudomonas moorei]KAB0509642.1 hypothetical protein F7R06_01075 [Pseudomonas moorei]SDR01476.1 hypothetical protein SAMN04490195_2755 [Pseudomonas moorei]